jgi:hypothetical protein
LPPLFWSLSEQRSPRRRKRRRTRRRPMTSRSFDHRLLLLFFPGHETHSIHCGQKSLLARVLIVYDRATNTAD